MRRSWRTCGEHPHCQQETQETQWDDKPNSYVVIHHRNADEQNDSPVAPERFLRAHEVEEWVERLSDRARRVDDRYSRLEGTAARIERQAVERVQALDERETRLALAAAAQDETRALALFDLLEIKMRLDILEERSRPWYQRMKGAR